MEIKEHRGALKPLKLLFLFLGSLLFLTSCEKEEPPLETLQDKHTSRFIPKSMNIDKARKSKEFMKLSSEFKLDELLNKQLTGKSDHHFSLDLTNFYEIRYDDYVSYTFLITRDTPSEDVAENLVIEQKNGVIGGYILRYEEIDYYEKASNIYLTAKVSKTSYEDNINNLLDNNGISFHRGISTNSWKCSTVVTATPKRCSVHGIFNSNNPACGNYRKSDWNYSRNEVCQYIGSGESLDTHIDQGDSDNGNGGDNSSDGGTTIITHCSNKKGLGLAGSNTKCTKPDPCDEVQDLIIDEKFSSKVSELESNLNLTRETGYSQNTDNSFTAMSLADSDGDMLTVSSSPTTKGYMHTHPDFIYKINSETSELEKKHLIPMFSPDDLKSFLAIAKNGNGTHFDVSDAYAVVITTFDNYMIKVNGSVSEIPSVPTINTKATKMLYDVFVTSSKDKAAGFLRFLKHALDITNLEIYEFDVASTSITRKYIDKNGKVKTTEC